MFTRVFSFCSLFLFLFSVSSFAQVDFDWDDGWDDNFDWYEESRPFMELQYGLGQPKHQDYPGDISATGLGELKAGFSYYEPYYENIVMELDENYFFVSSVSSELNGTDEVVNELDTEMWRFGLAKRDAYGYRSGSVTIFPFHEDAFVWSRLNVKNASSLMQDQLDITNRYDDAFRFGTFSAGGIKAELGDHFGLTASYEAAVVFPRYLIWKHLGSLVIEGVGYSAIDYFVEEVMDSSPAAGPVVDFILKNAYAYAIYSLKKDDMNWPFSTETPLTYETFKAGISVMF